MPGPTSSLNNDLFRSLSEQSVEQSKLLAKMEEQIYNISENIRGLKQKLDSLDQKIFIGNGVPSIMARLSKNEDEITHIKGDSVKTEESKKFWVNLVVPLVVTSSIASLAVLVQIVELLWKR